MKDRLKFEDEVLKITNTDRLTYINKEHCWLVSIQYKNKEVIGSGATRTLAIKDLFAVVIYKIIKE